MRAISCVMAGSLLLAPVLARAAAPATISFLGELKDRNGRPVTSPPSGTAVTFTLYPVPTGGTGVWSEIQTIHANAGLFSTALGSVTAFSSANIAFDRPYWVGVTVSGETAEMAPRLPLQSVPYALGAWSVGGNAGLDPAKQFLGTTDSQPLVLKANGKGAGLFRDALSKDGTIRSPDVILGSEVNRIAPGVIGSTIVGGGYDQVNPSAPDITNEIDGDYSFIGGGYGNFIGAAPGVVIGGGFSNIAGAQYASIGGGDGNQAAGPYAAVAGGNSNYSGANASFVGGGNANQAMGADSAVAGGQSNTAAGQLSAIGGGSGNTAGFYSFIGGGDRNSITDQYSVIAGGQVNSIAPVTGTNPTAAYDSAIGGGSGNVVNNTYAVVGGGKDNTASGSMSVVAGGNRNLTSSDYSIVGSGLNNWTKPGSDYSGVLSGESNQVSADHSVIAGGQANTVTGSLGAVGGGYLNKAGGNYAVIPGGYFNEADGYASFAAGTAAVAKFQGSFVWGDSSTQNLTMYDTAPYQFCIRATGGLVLEGYDNYPIYTGQDTRMLNRYVLLLNTPQNPGAAGLKAGRVLISDSYAYANPGFNNLVVKGAASIGWPTPGTWSLWVNGPAGGPYDWNSTSDARLKTNVATLDDALGTVTRLRGVSFEWNKAVRPELNLPGGRRVGLIAQEVEKVLPEVVHTDGDGYESVAYGSIVPVLVEAVKTLKVQNESLETENEKLLGKDQALEKRTTDLESRLNTLAREVESLRSSDRPSTR